MHGRCPAGCTTPLCEENDDPAGEIEILQRKSHYSATYAIELLLQNAGLIPGVPAQGARRERIRLDDFHRALDRILAETKLARRIGDRADLGRYDERFAGFVVSWEPMWLPATGGPRLVHGAPHVVHVQRLAASSGSATQPLSREAVDVPFVSGQSLSPLSG